ncbi:hypothetical protein [Flavobacterium sp.]|uniref:hypothetical protein n=1 Tax=Flavobacterium sp. TaxID=239 RepID=UPI00404776B1
MVTKNKLVYVTIVVRQLGMSLRYFQEDEFRNFIFDRLKYYEVAKEMLFESMNESLSAKDLFKNFILRKRKLNYFNCLVTYKLFKEFLIFLNSNEKDEKYIIHELMKPINILYWYLLRKKLGRKERKIIDNIESYGQNELVGQKYYSIEEALNILKCDFKK